MRSALRDAELPPPAGGWERLERELGGAAPELRAPETAAPRGSVWRIYWPRIAAAAAVVLLGVVAGDYMLRPDKALENDGNVIASTVEEAATAVTMPQPHAAESVREALAQAVGLADGQAAAPPVQQPGAARRSGEARGENGDGDCDGTDGRCRNDRRNFRRRGCRPALCEANGGGDFAARRRKRRQKRRRSAPRPVRRPECRRGRRIITNRSRRTSPRAGKPRCRPFAAGGVSGAVGGDGAAPRMYSSMTNDVSSIVGNGDNLSLMVRNDYSENSFRHHQPLSFGLSVRKEFAHGLSLESGVNYTLLRSDVTVKYSSEDVSQKLHFIGIPLRMNCSSSNAEGSHYI